MPTTLLDSETTGNFIDKTVARVLQILLRWWYKPKTIEIIDGSPLASGPMEWETIILKINLFGHRETIHFGAIHFLPFPLILGFPWLTLQNPMIRLKAQEVSLSLNYCHQHCRKSWMTDHPTMQDGGLPAAKPPEGALSRI